jgi:hypothetical protein
MLKALFVLILLLIILTGKAEAQKTCQRVSSTSQNCLATISWKASVVDATHDAPANYLIRRGDAGGPMTQIGSVAATSTSFQNTFTDAGNVAHCYEVVATLAGQSSPPSSPLACWTTPAISGTAPNTPIGVTIAAISASVLRITWDDVEDETGYEIWGRPAKGPREFDKLAAVGVDVTTWDWLQRKRYTSYCVEVLATGNPNSVFSNPVCATTGK